MTLPVGFNRANQELREASQCRGAPKTKPLVKQAQPSKQRLIAPQSVQQQPAHAATKPQQEPQTKRAPITIVVIEGRWLDIYCEERIDVELINLPSSPGSELTLEQFAESVLPKRHARQLCPGWIRFRGEIEALKPSEIARRVENAELIGRLRSEGPLYTGTDLLRIATGGRAPC